MKSVLTTLCGFSLPLFALLFSLSLPGRSYPPPLGQPLDVQSVKADPRGFLWVTTDGHGTHRFDGVRYLPATSMGLTRYGQQNIAFTADGTVWAQAGGELFRLDGARFVAVNLRTATTPIVAFGDVLYVNSGPLRAWHRQASGWTFTDGPALPDGVRLHVEPDGRVWYPDPNRGAAWVRFRDGRFEQGFVPLPGVAAARELIPGAGGSFWLGLVGGVRQVAADGAVRYEAPTTGPLNSSRLAGDSRETWYEDCRQWVSTRGRAWRVPALELSSSPVSGVWAAVGKSGVAFLGPEIDSYSLPGQIDRPVANMVRHGDRLYVARQDQLAFLEKTQPCGAMGVQTLDLKPWGKAVFNAALLSLAVSPDGGAWVVARDKGVLSVDLDRGVTASVPNPGGPPFVTNMRELAFTRDGRLWVASKRNLIEVLQNPKLAYAPVFPGDQYISGFTKGSDLVAVGDTALFHYEKGTWREERHPPCLLAPKIRTAAVTSPDERWFGYRDRDVFSRAWRAPGGDFQCEHFTSTNGFYGDTQFLTVDSQGRLWRGSNTGVYVRQQSGAWKWVLKPQNELYGEMDRLFFEDRDGSVYVSMNSRLMHFPPGWADLAPPGMAPVVSHFANNGELSLSPQVLASRLGDGATLFLSALPERAVAVPPGLQYRFSGDVWRPLRDHSLALDDAPRGATGVEIRYIGASAVLALPVQLHVPWWRAYWFYGALATVVGAGLWRLRAPWERWRYRRNKARYVRHAPPTESTGLAQGTLLHGRYRVQELIADGGFSRVYGAVDESTGARVVVKRLRPSDTPAEVIRRRFAQEVAAVSMVRDPGVVPILDAWIDDDLIPHLILPRIDGPTLRERFRKGGLPRGEAIAMLSSLAETLAAAHARGVVHSDFKPENILLAAERPMVIDFGTSALQTASGLNVYSRPAGSVQYMAPEQLLGRYSKATDVYAFALVAFEALTGQRYVDVDVPMNERWEAELRRVLAGGFALSPAVADCFVEALQFDPERRAQDVQAWMARLEQSI